MEYLEKLLGLGLQPSEMNTLQVCLRAFDGSTEDLNLVRKATLERDGTISVVKKSQ